MHDRASALEVLSTRVRARRRSLGLRQRDLAELAGCSERFVHMLERGKPTVQLTKVLDVLEVLGLGLTLRAGRGDVTAETSDTP